LCACARETPAVAARRIARRKTVNAAARTRKDMPHRQWLPLMPASYAGICVPRMETYDVFASYHLSPVKARVSAGAKHSSIGGPSSLPLLGRTFRPLRVRLEGRIKRLAAWNARGHVKERRVGGAHRHSAWATSRCPPYPWRGDGAPKSANLWCPHLLLGDTAGASRRATHALYWRATALRAP